MSVRAIAVLVLVSVIALLAGCAENQPEKLPAVKVVFTHYYAGKDHYVKIEDAEGVLVSRSDVRNVYDNPPFPGIHVYAYVFGENRRFVTPTTYVPIEKEGDNITVYVGFRGPEEVPEAGDVLRVVVDVVDKVDGGFQTVALDDVDIVWNVSWKRQ